MAAFQFPDPAVTQTVKNPTTGNTYQWKEDPGKWVLTNASDAFAADLSEKVSKDGDTMTGELKLANTDVSIIKNGKVHSQFGPTTSLMGSTLEVRGNIITLSNVSCRNVNSSSLVKATDLQVDGVSTFNDDVLVNGASTFNEDVHLTGTLTVKQTESGSQDGRIYLRGFDNASGISLYGAGGGIDMKGTLSFNSTNQTKHIRAYGHSSPTISFSTGSEASNAVERLSISSTGVVSNTNLISNYSVSGQNIIASGTLYSGANLNVETTSILKGNVTAKADVLIEGDLTLDGSFITSGSLDTFKSQVTIEAPYATSTPGLAIKTTNNNTSLWNSTQPGHLQFQTTPGSNGGTCGIFVNGESSSPSFTMAIGAPGYSLDRVFSYSYSAAYGKRIYIYPNWGQGYANAPNLPDQTPVTLGYLRANGLITVASTTTSQEAIDPSGVEHGDISFQTDVVVPSQLALKADIDGGQGFTIKGKTITEPTNVDADLFAANHYSSSQSAELDYNGSTAGANSIQTKTSVDAAITAAAPNLSTYVEETDALGNSYLFQNHASNVGSTLDGFFLFEYSKSSTGMVNIIVNAIKNTSITNGDVVGTLPEGYRPASGRWPVFTLINQNKDTTAQCVVTDDGKVTFIQVGGASTKFTGQLTFSTHGG